MNPLAYWAAFVIVVAVYVPVVYCIFSAAEQARIVTNEVLFGERE